MRTYHMAMAQSRSLSVLRGQCWLWSRRMCSDQPAAIPARRPVPAVSVQDERVQALLVQLTGMDLDKVFAARKEPLRPPTYKLLTKKELEKAHGESVEQAKRLLQMPPVLRKRRREKSVIEVDQKLAEAIKNRFIFTETTQHKDDKDRWIVVREVDGTLRDASWSERGRMCQLFFPKLGRKMNLPQMLQHHQLPEVLSLDHHLLVLDVANVQCEPDSKEYIRVHKTVYNDIEKRGLYDMLWSTRYFGGLVWHLLRTDNITGLFKHLINKERLEDATGLVELHLLCYPESDLAELLKGQTQQPDKAMDSNLIEAFWKWIQLQEDSEQKRGHDDNNERGHTSNGVL